MLLLGQFGTRRGFLHDVLHDGADLQCHLEACFLLVFLAVKVPSSVCLESLRLRSKDATDVTRIGNEET